MASFSVLVSLLLAVAAGQVSPAPPRDAAPRPTGTGTLAGVVLTDAADPKPVRHARVTLTSADPAVALTTVTGDDGRFTFVDLPPGRFTVSASKDGWLPSTYGAKAPLRPGTPVPIAAGASVTVSVRLVHGGAITGELLDASGFPAAGATVRAMRYSLAHGERRLTVYGSSAIADDRGIYRIYGLPPGDFVVGASWRPSYIAAGSELHLTSDADVRDALRSTPSSTPPPRPRTVALASTFYPGTPVAGDAALVPIRPGEERAGVDFTLQVVPTSRVEGTLALPGAAGSFSGALVALIATDYVSLPGTPVDAYRSAGIQPDGSFSFLGVTPGRYTLFARASGTTSTGAVQPHWASTDIAIDGDDLSGLHLTLAPGLSVSGQLRFDSHTIAPPADLKGVRLTLVPLETSGATMTPGAAAVDASGRFSFSGVIPGRYRVTAAFPGLGASGGWALHSAIVNGADAVDVPFAMTPNGDITGAIVTFSDRLGSIAGTLHDAAGMPAPGYSILLFPASASLWLPESRRIQRVRPAADGAFLFRNLPAGDYLLTAVDDVEDDEWFDASFLQSIVPSSIALTIADDEQRTRHLRVRAR